MKRTLLLFSLCATFLGHKAAAQETYNLNVFDEAVYYGMYSAPVDEPIPAGAIRHSNSSYAKMLTAEQLDAFGNTLTMTVTLTPLCDNYDRIGNVNLALVPVGEDTYAYNDASVKRIEIGRFITPFMDMHEMPNEVPYVFEINNLTNLFHDEAIRAQYNIWIELEVYGWQGTPGVDGAANEIEGCEDRKDVYMGTLDFQSGNDPHVVYGGNHTFLPLSFKYELKNYTLDGTDELGETVKTINFELEQAVPNAKLYLITSNHGANAGGEEYVRRRHYIYFDDEEVLNYRPGGVSCVPFRVYNTQPNCIYINCQTNTWRPDTNSAWSWNNWCPGDKIPIRVIELGDLAAGPHSFKIDVPQAVFQDGQGYFPMSVYLQGVETTLAAEDFNAKAFAIYPNPVSDIATIETNGRIIQKVTVLNTLGQSVFSGSGATIDMSKFQSGVYVVKVYFEDSLIATKKIVKD